MEYYGKNGKYLLESQPMNQGGEGAIYAVSGRSDLVAKIYFKERVTAELAEKLTFMANNPPDASILSQIAWPQDVLREQNGNFVGFVMPKLKIDSDLQKIYVYPPKKDLYITYEQKIIVAINICIVISAIHKAGYTFGDFNPLNIGVNLSSGHVAFLDTDSYHIYDKYNRKMYRCGVCLAGYVAPELIEQCKGTDYLSAPLPTFTQETDKFALAIHIFKLLMNGYSPFNGIKENESVSQASPGIGNKAIENDSYCFKTGNKPQSVATPDLSAFPPDIQYLFKRAFVDGRGNPESRPSADEWYKALLDYKKNLVQCKRDVNHFYYVNDRECPYCAAEERYNSSLGSPSSGSQITFSQPISVPSSSNAGNYMPSSASSPSASGSSKPTYVGAGGYMPTSTYKKTGDFTKRLIGWIAILAIAGVLFGFVIWPKMIYPNMDADSLYTPEIVQTYCKSEDDEDLIITFTECTDSGEVTAVWESYSDRGYYKVNLKGNITEKKNNGDMVIQWTSNEVINIPSSGQWQDEVSATITDDYRKLKMDADTLNAGVNNEYNITAAEDFKKLINSDKTYHLKNDIDMVGKNWTPIEGFTGMLMGNGFTIKNMTIEASSSNVGFFSVLDGMVTNLNFENADIKVSGANENVGTLCGLMRGSASNITVSGKVDATNSKNVGGVIGSVNIEASISLSEIENFADVQGKEYVGGIAGYYYAGDSALSSLKNNGTIMASGNYAGGLMGYAIAAEIFYNDHTFNLQDASNSGDVIGKQYVGGLFGEVDASSSGSGLTASSCNAVIEGDSYVGCIAGKISNIRVEGCSNAGSSLVVNKYVIEDSRKNAYVGGFAGYGYSFSNCTNEVDIPYTAGGRYVGGVAGYVYNRSDTVEMNNLENKASISGADYVGGIFGYQYTGNVLESSFKNSGTITASGNYAGGLMGYAIAAEILYNGHTFNLQDASNSGDVIGKQYVGGLFGEVDASSSDSSLTSSSCDAVIEGDSYVGCIAGKVSNIRVEDCSNAGSSLNANGYVVEDATQCAYVGGFAGYGYSFSNCINEVDIQYTARGRYVGGVAGYVYNRSDTVEMNNLENKASISGADYVGGIFGYQYTGNVQESFFKNSGTITASGNYAGGLMGYAIAAEIFYNDHTFNLLDALNTGDITGKQYVGGLFGHLIATSTNSAIVDSSSTGKVTGQLKDGMIAGVIENVTIQ